MWACTWATDETIDENDLFNAYATQIRAPIQLTELLRIFQPVTNCLKNIALKITYANKF